MTLTQIIQQIHALPANSNAQLQSCIREIHHPKGHILLQSGRVESNLYLIKKGIVRAFSSRAEGDITFWFGQEGEAILSMRSYVEHQKSYENIELLEDCELFELRIDELNRLYEEDIHIANWGRRLAEKELLKTEIRWVDFEFLSARERYDKLMADKPTFIQRIPLKYIASYLGMTQVSLSRIRKSK